MDDTERFKIFKEIVSEFHHRVKIAWTTMDDVRKGGQLWLENIKERYQDIELYSSAQEVVFSEIFYFHNNLETTPLAKKSVSNDPPFALIMKGGGIKGLAYIGALEELFRFYKFNWYAGTSAGAISAILLAAGYNLDELNEVMRNKDFSDFKDANFIKACYNLFSKKGCYEANTFVIWLNHLLAVKLDSPTAIKLKNLKSRVTVYASRREKPALIFDSSNPEYASMQAAFAARCSMSIPFLFTPQKSEGLNVFDGGLQNNFPVQAMLNDSPETDFLALYLGPEIFEYKKSSIWSDFESIWTEAYDTDTIERHKDKVVIIDPRPISTYRFKLSDREKEFLVENGRLAALKFLDKRGKLSKHEHNYVERKENLETERNALVRIKRQRNRKRKLKFSFLFIVILLGLNYEKLTELVNRLF
ncbi:patatin-like phospholipase family protein [Maribacter sp. 2-571]|uniref:patatin-like phospholipase family protein n=1 Tax=Maribacter sp. 2-571 TaxID=3417569 RepID=UPI003D34A107